MKWYIVNVNETDLHTKKSFDTKEDAMLSVARDIGDKRRVKTIQQEGNLFYYQYGVKVFWIVDEETALRDGFEWIVKKANPEKKRNELECVRYVNRQSSYTAS